MSLSLRSVWNRTFRSLRRSPLHPLTRRPASRPQGRLRLEALEDRLTPGEATGGVMAAAFGVSAIDPTAGTLALLGIAREPFSLVGPGQAPTPSLPPQEQPSFARPTFALPTISTPASATAPAAPRAASAGPEEQHELTPGQFGLLLDAFQDPFSPDLAGSRSARPTSSGAGGPASPADAAPSAAPAVVPAFTASDGASGQAAQTQAAPPPIASAAGQWDTASLRSSPHAAAAGSNSGGTQSLLLDPIPFGVSGFVWDDANANGLQDSGEGGVANVSVNLLLNGTVFQSAVTNSAGVYQFFVEDAGNFQVQVVLPTGTAVAPPYTGAGDVDSNVDAEGLTEVFPFNPLQGNDTLDAGLVPNEPAVVNGAGWLDGNGDGVHGGGEAGMAGLTVNLYDVASNLVATTTTGAGGAFQFPNVTPNAPYLIEFVVPEGYQPTGQHVGTPSTDSDVDAYGVTDWFWVGGGGVIPAIDIGLVPASAPPQPLIVFVSATNNFADKLRVARWASAFEKPGATVQLKTNFIDLDPDRFNLWVVDAVANRQPGVKDKIVVKVSTSSDVGNNIELEETDVNTGKFRSKNLLLASVKLDDDHAVDGITDNTTGDRTFLVKLGDTVTATYGGMSTTATVAVEKTVKLNIKILRKPDGNPSVTVADVDAQVKWANEIYAGVGIKFTYGAPAIVNPPAGGVVDLRNGLEEATALDANGKIIMTAEGKALLGDATLRTAATNDVEVYFVNYLAVNGVKSDTKGQSYPASAVPDPKYMDSIIIGERVYNTLAHELGHVLMDSGEHAFGGVGINIVNLMADPYQVDGTITDSRRITGGQANAMHVKRPNLFKP